LPCWGGKELYVTIEPEDETADVRATANSRFCAQYCAPNRHSPPHIEDALSHTTRLTLRTLIAHTIPSPHRDIPNSGPPVLTNPSQVWSYDRRPRMWIDWHFHTPAAVEFKLTFNCNWGRRARLRGSIQGGDMGTSEFSGGFDVLVGGGLPAAAMWTKPARNLPWGSRVSTGPAPSLIVLTYMYSWKAAEMSDDMAPVFELAGFARPRHCGTSH